MLHWLSKRPFHDSSEAGGGRSQRWIWLLSRISASLLHRRQADVTEEDCLGPSYSLIKNNRITLQRDRAVDVIICVHNAFEHVRPCLDSVLKTLGNRHRLIVIDDASDEITGNYLSNLRSPQLCVHRNAKRQGYTKSANIGLRLSRADFVILLNSDCLVTQNWIEKLCDAVYSRDGAGIVGPMSSAASYQSIPNIRSTVMQTATNDLPPNMSVQELDLWCETWTKGWVMPQVPLVHGFCFGIRRMVMDRIGLFDERLFGDGFGEEDDYCLRASDAGFGLLVATHTYIFHAKTKSYSLAARHALAQAAERKVRERHGHDRFNQALQELEANRILQAIRLEAAKLYA
jgi:GT2 family glycosyltransferase